MTGGNNSVNERLPDFEFELSLARILEWPGGGRCLAAMLAKEVGIHLERRPIGLLIRQPRGPGPSKGAGRYERSAGSVELRPGADLESELVALLHEFDLGISARQHQGSGLAGVRFRAVVIDVTAGQERLFAAIVVPQAGAADPAQLFQVALAVAGQRFAIAHEEIVVIAVVAAFDADEAGDGSAVRGMKGRVAGWLGPVGDLAGKQIVHVSPALGHVQQVARGEEQVVIHQKWPMVHLDEQVVAGIVMEEVPRYPGALRHPVQPEPEAGSVDVVMGDDRINGGVELDAGHLRPGEEAADVDVVNRVAGNRAERGAQAADDTGLLAV